MRLRREKTESRSISASALGEDFWVWTNERDDGSTGLQDHGLLALGPECPYRIHGPEVCGPEVLLLATGRAGRRESAGGAAEFLHHLLLHHGLHVVVLGEVGGRVEHG